MKYLSPVLSVAIIFSFAFFPLVAQEAEEEPAGEPEEAVEEVTEEAEEEVTEEVAEEAVPEETVMEQEAVEAESPLAGFTAGLNIGWPIITGEFLKDASETGPNIGVIVGTPYGFVLGPFSIGVGAEILSYNWGDYYSGVAILGTVNTALNDLLPMELPGILSVQIGGGLFGGGVGTTIGGSFDYAVPNVPLLVRGYARGNATTAAGGDVSIKDKPTGWINIGVMLSYDISTLF